MSPTLYSILWAVYLLSGVLLLWLVWSFTRWERVHWLGHIVRLIVFVLLFTPAKLYQQPDHLVPATMAMAFDYLLGNEDAAFASMVNLIVSAIVCTLIFIIYTVILQILHSRKSK